MGLGYRSSSERVGELAAQLRADGHDVWLAQADLSDPSQARRIVEESPVELGGVVYAAGPHIRLGYVSTLSAEEFSDAIDSDLKACFNFFTAALPAMRASGGGPMLAVSTMAATRYATRDALSAIPKAGVEMLARAISVEEGRFNIRCNVVSAGPIDGEGVWDWFIQQGYFDEQSLEVARRGVPLGRFGSSADIAHAGAFLMSDEASWISGQVLGVDGGFTAT